jgi:c-di-GMP-binding flagellar brake protein YcgR
MPNSPVIPLQSHLTASADDSRYVVESELEIAFILRAIMRRNALVSVYFDDSNGFILTTLLDIDTSRRKLTLDHGSNEAFNRLALNARELVVITSQDGVKVRFDCDRIESVTFEGRDAFSTNIPRRLVRMQRREYYRIATPRTTPLACSIPLPAGQGSAEITLLDIGCGGIGVIDHHPKIHLEPGATHEHCTIVLPETGTLDVTIRVKTTFEDTLRYGRTCKHAGCEFIGISESMLAMIQRYIMKVERERNVKQARWA